MDKKQNAEELSQTVSVTAEEPKFPPDFDCVPLPQGGYKLRWLNDKNATEAIIPQGIREIDPIAFIHCQNLRAVVIPEGVGSIQAKTFDSRYSLKTIDIPESVTYIEENAFAYCYGLENVIYHGEKEQWEKIRIEKGNDHLFSARITHVGNTLTKDGFTGICDLKAVLSQDFIYLCESKDDGICVGEYRKDDPGASSSEFKNRAVAIVPEGVNTICQKTFKDRTIAIIYLPGSLKKIEKNAFSGCKGLFKLIYRGNQRLFEMLDIEDGNDCLKSVSEKVFVDECPSERDIALLPFKYEELTDGKIKLTSNEIRYCTYAVIPSDTVEICEGAFDYSLYLKAVKLPDTLNKIGKLAFYRCKDLASIDIPESVTEIGKEAFADSGLTSVTLPAGLTRIEESTFAHTKLTSITIPTGTSSIGARAFEKCDSLTDVYYAGTKKQWKAIKIKRKGNKPLLKAKIHFEQ